MINLAIYNMESGEIRRRIIAQESTADLQCDSNEEFFLNCPPDATHIVYGEPMNLPPPESRLLTEIREKRNWLLTSCDWTQMPDVPLTSEECAAWRVYRQELRDFPAICDLQNPVWPLPPA